LVLGGEWRHLGVALERRRDALAKVRGVVAVGLGHKVHRGVETDEPALVVFVKKKLSRRKLDSLRRDLLPSFVRVHKRRVPVDVLEMGVPVPHGPIGSLGPVRPLEAATIGAIAHDAATDEPVLLTAMHVLGVPTCQDGYSDPVEFTVPARQDDPAAPVIGNLLLGTTYGVDAAKVALRDPAAVAPYLPPLRIVGVRPVSNDVNTSVTMFGKTSGRCHGVVKYVSVSIPEYCLEQTILVAIHSAEGDSGGPLVDATSLLLGFLFGRAPSSFGDFGVFCPAVLVLSRLACTIP
jgi:hypothetical protein